MKLKALFKYLVFWRLLLFIPAMVGLSALPFKDSFPYRDAILVPFGHPLFYSWASFDGVHYLSIAAQGYALNYTQAFFPIFPFAIKYLDFINNHLLTGLILVHASLILAIYYFYKLIRLDFSHQVAVRTLMLLLVFPTAFYFGSLYTESMFLLFCVLAFYKLRTKKLSQALFWAALASGTRIIGILLVPALMLEYYFSLTQKNKQKKAQQFKSYLPFILGGSGLFAYMAYLHFFHDDALYFLSAQPAFGAERSSDKLILLYQVIYRYIKMLLTVEPRSLLYFTVVQEFVISLLFFGLSLFSFKKVRPSYALFSILAFLLPTLTGTFSSMPRYALMLFPCFILVGQIKSPWLYKIILTISAILLFVNTLLFTRGYWVS